MRRPLVQILLTAIIGTFIFANLRQPWAAIPWLIAIGIWAGYFWFGRAEEPKLTSSSPPFEFGLLLLTLAAAAAVRLYRLGDFPLGANIDEIFTLNNSLRLLEKPFDLF